MNHSTLYPFALFLHVVGVMALVAFYGSRCRTFAATTTSKLPGSKSSA